MNIRNLLDEKMTFSFEVFPPKEEYDMKPLLETVDKLLTFNPDFISVTYGAGGTNIGKSKEVCSELIDRGDLVLSHFTCMGNSKQDVLDIIGKYKKIGVSNFLCLRGDFPEGWTDTRGYYEHADRLIYGIKEEYPELCLGGACYPERHIDSESALSDIAHLRSKQNNGAEFFMSQLCYDLNAFEKFLDKLEKAQINLPVVAGVMPVLYKNGLLKMTMGNGCSIPSELAHVIGKYGDKPEEFKKAGKEYTKELIFKYMSMGIDGLHLYSLNKYRDLAEILCDCGIRGNYVVEEL